jgi:group I intron endonuclease
MENLKQSGIYKIVNLKNNKLYIGSAAGKFGIYQRFQDHKKTLRSNRHSNFYLQKSWNKYNEESFSFEVVEFCEKEKCIEREQFYINSLSPEYNICRTAGNTLGVACEDFMTVDAIIIKRKRQSIGISKALKGKAKTDEHAINCGAKHFNVYEAVCIQFRKKGKSSLYEKGQFIGKWLKREECGKYLNVSSKSIRRCLSNKRPQTHGYIFKYEVDDV